MDTPNNNLKKIRLVATGGTIASEAKSRVSTEGYRASVIPVDELIAQIPEVSDIASVSAEQIFLKPSSAITSEDLIMLSGRINELLASDDCDGVIVTHGTDTMEETAFFLNLTVSSPKPVVVTGAMRPSHVVSSDGLLNLYNAVCCAASEQSYGMGVVIAMNDLILSARDAVKFSTFKTDAFQAPLYGVLGTIRNGEVSYCYKPLKRHTVSSEFTSVKGSLAPVEILYMYEGCTDTLFKAALDGGCKGLVTAGTGNGGVIGPIMNIYNEEDSEKTLHLPILVRSARVPTGGVSDSYRHKSEKVIPAGDLNPQKAYILLRLALTVTDDPSEIRRIFTEY
ncbi:MAG: asparaginase [Clostridiaceae bacterium]|nr:asparaginase [Clostridiaceae bacterium]